MNFGQSTEHWWTGEQEAELVQMLNSGLDDEAICARTGRSIFSIRAKRRRFGVMRFPSSSWSEAEIETLKRLLAEGLSASLISEQLPGKSRGAVIGKASRMGINRRHPAFKRNSGAVIEGVKAATRRHKRNGKSPPIEVIREVAVECAKVEFFDLQPHHCRYPVDEKGDYGIIKFCGLNKWGDSSYCADHLQLIYRAR